MHRFKQIVNWIITISLLFLAFSFWYVFFHYLRLIFYDFWTTVKSLALLFIPITLTIIAAYLLLQHFTQWSAIKPYTKYIHLNRFFLHIVFVLFLANVGIIYTINLLGKAAGTCMTAQDVMNDPATPIAGGVKRCFMLYSNNVYNHKSGGQPDPISTLGHMGHGCQILMTSSNGTIYDATYDIDTGSYGFHKTSNYVGINAQAYVAPLCTTVTSITTATEHVVFISDPITTSPTPIPTASPSPSPTKSPSPTPTPTATPSPTPTKSPTPSPTPTRSPSPTPTSTPTASPSSLVFASPSSSPLAVLFNVNLLLRFEAITTSGPNQNLSVVFTDVNDPTKVTVFNPQFISDTSGLYRPQSVQDLSVKEGVYKICVQSERYLVKCAQPVSILVSNSTAQTVTIDLSNQPFLAGNSVDTGPSADKIDIYDYNNLVSNFGCLPSPASPPPGKNCVSNKSDFDFDGDIDIYDYSFLVGNFGVMGN